MMGAARPLKDTPSTRFAWLKANGFKPIAIYAPGMKRRRDSKPDDLTKGKEPMGAKWGLRDWSLDDFQREDRRCRDQVGQGAGVGVCLGPERGPGGSWLIDVEGDGPEAEESRAKLFGGEVVETMGWASARGAHQLYIAAVERLAEIVAGLTEARDENGKLRTGVFTSEDLPGLELRLGGYIAGPERTVKQVQSVVPPTLGTDGRPREWIGPSVVAQVPESFYQVLTSLARNAEPERAAPTAGPTRPEPSNSHEWTTEARAVAYLDKCDPSVSGSRGHDKAFKAACKIGPGFNLAPEVAFSLLRDHFNPRCQPPWSEAELRHKVDEAYKSEARRGWFLENDKPARKSKGNRTGRSADGTSERPPLNVVGGREDEQRQGPLPEAEGLPEIICGYEDFDEGFKKWTPKALSALAKANAETPFIFQRDGQLVRLRRPATEEETYSLQVLNVDSLRGVLDRVAYWGNEIATRKGKALKYGSPRIEIVRDILSLEWLDPEAFPPIDLIAEAPLFATDGHMIAEPGFHRESRVYYAPSPELVGLEIPRHPSSGDIAAALSLIFDDLLIDFPFRNAASRANALAVLLLPFARLMIEGPSPNHHFSASTEGTGKGLCATACAFPFLGREVDISVQKESEAEWRKAITSFLMSGASHYFIDNMYNPVLWGDESPRDVDSGTLAAAWTGRRWQDRILGGQDEAKIKVKAVFMSSGNNVTFSRELTRRLVNIELVAESENPSLRTGFKHDPIIEWMRDNRAALTRACLVLVRNWIALGRKPGRATMGSYESYARTMGGILEAAGVSGFLDNRPKVKSGRDRESIRWPSLIDAWHRDRGTMATSTGQLFDLIFGDPGQPELRVAFADVIGEGKILSQKQKFGRAIGKQEGRVWGDWRIGRTSSRTADGAVLYRLVDPTEAIEEDDDPEAWAEGRE